MSGGHHAAIEGMLTAVPVETEEMSTGVLAWISALRAASE